MEILQIINDYMLYLCAIPLAIFIFMYAKFSPWRNSNEGRTVMYQKIVFLVYFLFIMATNFFGTWPGREYTRSFIYLGLLSAFTAMLVNLLKAQKEARDECREAIKKEEENVR